ncbi:Biotin carboxyl carrier protein of acetyl-CoA carboxylase [Candidatus Terasakiella magnetica]|uniref:Biotin carboxyl carrier protein of acetyl-CoA carboxylase n=1 Tax=Candidatus Terasakiella magnetica TaxID=1867952 RepID=A0A1C3RD33_9PROT|nr:acetyl-CoA carboxylase biotin carboxyl carrier protein subunit [Candidatus Terasakiella magnetica]SCA55193.1 Biotin carboxyl carrier protein of acetyl-CoA carboxylase [Candidatus Terasakiella magnetica]
MAKDKFNNELVRELAELLNDTGLTEIEYGQDDWHVRVAKNVTVSAAAPVAVAAAPAGAAPADENADMSNHPGAVSSPMVGVAYLSPDPDSPNFVNVGDSVTEGQTLCLIEAMKVFNPIHAPKAGKVSRVLVTAGSPVEFGDTLFIIE